MRVLFGMSCVIGVWFVPNVAVGQEAHRPAPYGELGSPYIRTELLRAGISRASADTLQMLPQHIQTHRVKHAAIGAGLGTALGLVVGAAIGAQIDNTRPGTYSAIPIVAIEGAGIGLAAGLVVGALIP